MDPRKDELFDRTSWRRLLGADSGAPTADMDRRVLAEARRALMPHVARWWLPASLAASLLLAVLIVQWQLADSALPAHVTESDVLSVPAPIAADKAAPAATMELPAQRQQEPAAPAASVAPPLIDLPMKESRPAPVAEIAAAVPAAPGPAQRQDQAESAVAIGKLRAMESSAKPRAPEDWYADIEALRAAGRVEEADAELARLEAAWPGWLASHHSPNH